MKELDLTKPYTCRNGWMAEVLHQDPLVGVMTMPDGRKLGATWEKNGRYDAFSYAMHGIDHHYDLINVPEKKVAYAVIGENGYGFIGQEADARHYANYASKSIIRIEYPEGQKDI